MMSEQAIAGRWTAPRVKADKLAHELAKLAPGDRDGPLLARLERCHSEMYALEAALTKSECGLLGAAVKLRIALAYVTRDAEMEMDMNWELVESAARDLERLSPSPAA